MTAFGHEERVQESGVVGHSYDTDDRLEDLDIYEALVNPHDGQGGSQKRGGGGAPAMMPMGNTGSASKVETAAATGTTAAGSAKGTSAASAGAGRASGLSGTGGAGVSGTGGAGGGGGASASTANLGVKTVQASPEMLHKEAQYWDDTAKDFTANVANPVGNQSPSSVDFGMMTNAFSPYNDLLNRLKKWSTDAGTEFSAISDTLQSASGGYKDTEDTNTAASTQVQTHSSIPV